jgi:CMP/dCMP kinase
MIITISGKPGAGKSTAAKALSQKLKLRHYSIGDLMGEMAIHRNISLLELSGLAEHDPSIDRELDERQIELGKTKDDFVIDSRLGFFFIPASIKIFLDVSLQEGAKRIFKTRRADEKENTSLQATVLCNKKRVRSERKRYRDYYGVDHLDKKNYDIVINTTHLTPQQVALRILDKIRKL